MTNTQPYADLEIRILERQDAGYPVEITLNGDQHFPRGFLAADLLPWISTGAPRADGERLFTALIADAALREAWANARGQHPQRRVGLRLDTTAPELHALPWELLHDGLTFITADAATPFSRYLPGDAPWSGLVAERPIRVLIVIANPADLDQYGLTTLVVDTERTLLSEALDALTPTHFCLEYLEAPVTPERLERALASGPHVLHFVGHGAFSERRQEAVLYLQDDSGNAQIVTDAQLCDILRRQGTLPRLIFLAACQSAERSTVDVFAGLAPKLVQTGVPAVVAMQDKVAIAATHKLTPVFYEELARHGEVDRALNAARSLLLTGQAPDAATPVLLMRMKDGQLWEPLWTKTNPYRGLAAFTEDEAAFFFGREQLIEELLAHLRSAPRFLVVVGSSGSGKSSVVQAGLIPALRKGGLPGSQSWQIVTFRPGNDPYAALREVKVDLAGIRKSGKSESRLLLYADQFEELFALCSETVQQQFLDDLLTLIESATPVTVILTVRADFYGHLLRHALGECIKEAQVNVLPMKPEDLRAAIAEPARKAGLRFEAGLVETIIQDTSASAHVLPLLQSALTQLWHKQMQGMLTYDAYQAIGGVAGAISVWADDAYSGLSAPEQPLARRVLTRLVHYGEGGAADTRQRQALADLVTEPGEQDALRQLVKKLADARLVVTGEGETVEIIHDALLREWARLKQWITEQREFYLWRQRLDAQLQTWEGKKQDEGALLRGALLVEAERWLQEQPDELNEGEEAYIQAGIAAQERERQARELRRRRILVGTATAALLLLILAVIAGMGWNSSATKEQARATAQAEAVAEATRALNAEATAQAEATRALNAEATAQAEATRALNAEATAQAEATRALNAEATAQAEAVRAEQQAKIALARQLAAQTELLLSQRAEEITPGVLLAAESLTHTQTLEGDMALRHALTLLPRLIAQRNFTGAILGVDFHPNGQWIALGTGDERQGQAVVWDMVAGRLLLQTPHPTIVRHVQFSPEGRWLLSGSDDGLVVLSEVATGEILTQTQFPRSVTSVMFTADSRYLAVGDAGGVVRAWEIVAGEHLAVRAIFSDSIGSRAQAVARTETGQWRALAESLGAVRNLTTGQSEPGIPEAWEWSNVVALSPDGNWVAAGGSCTAGETSPVVSCAARVWVKELTAEAVPLPMMHQGTVHKIVYGSINSWGITHIATASEDGTARVWGIRTGEEVARLIHPTAVTDITFSPDGMQLLTAAGNVAYIWDIVSGKELARMTHESPITQIAFNPGGRAFSLDAAGEGKIWMVGGIALTTLSHPGPTYALAFSPDYRWVIASGFSRFGVWDVASGKVITDAYLMGTPFNVAANAQAGWIAEDSDEDVAIAHLLTGERFTLPTPRGLWLSPGGRWLAAVEYAASVQLWDTTTWQRVLEVGPLTKSILGFGSDAYFMAAINGQVQIWDLQSRRSLATLDTWESFLDAALDPQGKKLAVQDGAKVTLYRVPEMKQVVAYEFGTQPNRLVFSPDGSYLAAGADQQVYVRSTEMNVSPGMTLTHSDRVDGVTFNPDGRRLATLAGSIVRIWETANGRELTRIELNGQGFSYGQWMAFIAEGRQLLTANQNDFTGSTEIHTWPVWPADLIDLACSRLTRNLTHAEWAQYLGDEPYRATCPNLPIPED